MQDLDFVAINKDDKPYIPSNIENAPVLEVLKRKNEKNFIEQLGE